MVTKQELIQLSSGYELHHRYDKNADGSPERWRINGVVKLWKTRPNEFKCPIKRGLKQYGYFTHNEIHHYCLTAEDVYISEVRELMHGHGTCKPNNWDEVKHMSKRNLRGTIKHLSRFTFATLFGDVENYLPCRNFGFPIGAQVFIATNGINGKEYLINTEGYPYCRYIVELKK